MKDSQRDLVKGFIQKIGHFNDVRTSRQGSAHIAYFHNKRYGFSRLDGKCGGMEEYYWDRKSYKSLKELIQSWGGEV